MGNLFKHGLLFYFLALGGCATNGTYEPADYEIVFGILEWNEFTNSFRVKPTTQ